jgi:hypothetical protein
MPINWVMVEALASALYAVAFMASIILVLRQLRKGIKDEFLTGTATTFAIWEEDDFQRAQQWLLYELQEQTWHEFVAAHRGQYGERAFIRVGAFYNRIGYMVSYHLLEGYDAILLDTVGGLAIAVWQKIEPLVLEARLIENSTLFQDFERMLPRCYECYVPTQPVPPDIREAAAGVEQVLNHREATSDGK